MRALTFIEATMFYQLDSEQLADRLRDFWMAMGMIAALIASFAFSFITAAPDCPSYTLTEAFGFAMGVSGGGYCCCAICCCILYGFVGAIHPERVRIFINKTFLFICIPTIVFGASSIAFVVGMCPVGSRHHCF
jgi:hypothetical protein